MKDKKIKNVYFFLIVALIVITTIVIVIVIPKNNGNNEDNKPEIRKGPTNEEFTVYDDAGVKLNISEKIKEPKEIEGLTLSNIQINENNGQTNVIVYVTNNTANNIEEPFDINLILLDKDGQEIIKLPAIVPSLNIGDTKSFSSSITEDCSNVYDIKIERATAQPVEE